VQPPREERGIEVGQHDLGAKLRSECSERREVISLNEAKFRGPSRNADQAPRWPARHFVVLPVPCEPDAFPIDRDRCRSTLRSFHSSNRALSDRGAATFRRPASPKGSHAGPTPEMSIAHRQVRPSMLDSARVPETPRSSREGTRTLETSVTP
jgi:hypothetical protein